ncbi:MAG: hypothetical protein ACI8RD_002365 [Bacillariaceae sp.]|jgi:hypothetical protein
MWHNYYVSDGMFINLTLRAIFFSIILLARSNIYVGSMFVFHSCIY